MPIIRLPLRELSKHDAKDKIKSSGWNAENALFSAIQQYLSAEWVVWMNPELNLPDYNGEADCILYHNSYGMILIETKGGKLNCEEKQWKQGKRFLKKSPLEQARMNLRSLQGVLPNGIRLAAAVCFPDMSDRKSIALLAASDLDVILKGHLTEDLFENKLIEILTQSKMRFGDRPIHHTPLDKPERKALSDLLMGKCGTVSPKSIWDAQSRARESVRNFQRIFMDAYHSNKKMMMSGVAGSGKTKMSEWEMEKFVSEKKRVAYACYNVLLCQHLQYRYAKKNIEIREFYSWADYIAKALGLKVPKQAVDERADHYYNETLLTFMQNHVCDLPEEAKFDALFIDEGQDLDIPKFEVLHQLLREDGYLRFMYDELQTIFSQEMNKDIVNHVQEVYPYITRFNLKNTYRNTKKIVEWVNEWCDMRLEAYSEVPEGDGVKEVFYKDDADLHRLLQIKVNELKKRDIEPREIMVVSLAGQQRSGLEDAEINNCVMFPQQRDPSVNKANVFSVYRIKGLESNCVFLVDNYERNKRISSYEEEFRYKRLLAVAATRARSILYVFKPE